MVLTAGHCYTQGTSINEAYLAKDSATEIIVGEHVAHFYGTKSSADASHASVRVGADNDYHGDVSLINVSATNHATTASLWKGGTTTTTTKQIYARYAPVVDELLCIGGAFGGEKCGLQVTATNVDWNYDSSTTMRNVDLALGSLGKCSVPGDSGGSVYYWDDLGYVAVGVISGHFSGTSTCYQVFTGAEEAQQAWGGTLDQH